MVIIMKQNFEESMVKLENIVKQLEKNEVSLEESLKLFEEGIRLSQVCQKLLEDADRRVSVLLENEAGQKVPADFRPSGE